MRTVSCVLELPPADFTLDIESARIVVYLIAAGMNIVLAISMAVLASMFMTLE